VTQAKTHTYSVTLEWTGDRGDGTKTYAGYGRDHVIRAAGKPDLLGSSDPQFRGDGTRYNPEDLLVASLSACHMLWYLHLASSAGIVVTTYHDAASGSMVEDSAKGGYFSNVTLRPVVTIAKGGDKAKAQELHRAAHTKCFIANSVNFPVRCDPETLVTAG
jgi:organic hydroperoxide reductase OsmC/OhrA